MILAAALLLSVGCAPFSELQDARVVGKGRVEVTPGVGVVDWVDENESTDAYDDVGIQVAWGVGETTDLRMRLERLSIDGGSSYNVFGIGPKMALTPDRTALYLPVGLAFGENIGDEWETVQFHPTLLATFPLGRGVDLNPSVKGLIPVTAEDGNALMAVNIGLGLSTDPERWILRPEIGYLFDPGEDGHYRHFSLGLTIFN